MKRIIWTIVAAVFLGALSDISLAQGGKMYVKVKKENIRKGMNGKKLGELLGGTEVEVLERRSNWVKVQFTGWIWDGSLVSDSTRVDGYQIRVSHILVKTQAEANKVLTELSSGKKFADLARQYSVDKASASKGGDLGVFGRGDLSDALASFETAAFNLKLNGVSKVIQSDLGFHIIKRTQ